MTKQIREVFKIEKKIIFMEILDINLIRTYIDFSKGNLIFKSNNERMVRVYSRY